VTHICDSKSTHVTQLQNHKSQAAVRNMDRHGSKRTRDEGCVSEEKYRIVIMERDTAIEGLKTSRMQLGLMTDRHDLLITQRQEQKDRADTAEAHLRDATSKCSSIAAKIAKEGTSLMDLAEVIMYQGYPRGSANSKGEKQSP
jgi:hypothetical protein